jgi:hypothetical protein
MYILKMQNTSDTNRETRLSSGEVTAHPRVPAKRALELGIASLDENCGPAFTHPPSECKDSATFDPEYAQLATVLNRLNMTLFSAMGFKIRADPFESGSKRAITAVLAAIGRQLPCVPVLTVTITSSRAESIVGWIDGTGGFFLMPTDSQPTLTSADMAIIITLGAVLITGMTWGGETGFKRVTVPITQAMQRINGRPSDARP